MCCVSPLPSSRAVVVGLLVMACTGSPERLGLLAEGLDSDGIPTSWLPERLCERYVLIANHGTGSPLLLTVRDPPQPAKAQVVDLKPEEAEHSFRQVWQFRDVNPDAGTCRIWNPRPPYNSFSLSLKAEGISPDPGLEEFAQLPALTWILHRSGEPEIGNRDDVWFELIPSTEPELSLEATPGEERDLALTRRPTSTVDTPASKLWRFTVFPCE